MLRLRQTAGYGGEADAVMRRYSDRGQSGAMGASRIASVMFPSITWVSPCEQCQAMVANDFGDN